jgi:cysteine desulfurase
MKQAEIEGAELSYLSVNEFGQVNVEEVSDLVKPETRLVSIQYVNNEVGTIQDVSKLAKIISGINKSRSKENLTPVYFHVDACQAFSYLECNLQVLGAHLVSANASKIGGPKQSGILYKNKAVKINPLIYGGGQEFGLLSGTESVAMSAGFCKALELCDTTKALDVSEVRNYLWEKIVTEVPNVAINGVFTNSEKDVRLRIPNNLNVYFEGVLAEDLMIYLDSYNIAVSTGSACDSGVSGGSYVLKAMGFSKERARGSVRFTLLDSTSREDVDYVARVLKVVVKSLRTVQVDLR